MDEKLEGIEITSKCTWGKIDCPFCGYQADCHIVEIWSGGICGGAWVKIDCQACGFSSFEHKEAEV